MSGSKTTGFPAIFHAGNALQKRGGHRYQALVYIMVSINLNYDLVLSKSPILVLTNLVDLIVRAIWDKRFE